MSNHKSSRVLIIDDKFAVRLMLKLALEKNGLEVIEAEDYEAALWNIESARPDLIVLDINLGSGEYDGLDILKKVREKGWSVPVIVLTVIDRTVNDRYLRDSISLGADVYLTKRDELKRYDAITGLERDKMLPLGITEFCSKESSDISEIMTYISSKLYRRGTNSLDADTAGSPRQIDRTHIIDLPKRLIRIQRNDQWYDIDITRLQTELLELLLNAQGAMVNHARLMSGFKSQNSYHNAISSLNMKLNADGEETKHIENVPGQGYRFRFPG